MVLFFVTALYVHTNYIQKNINSDKRTISKLKSPIPVPRSDCFSNRLNIDNKSGLSSTNPSQLSTVMAEEVSKSVVVDHEDVTGGEVGILFA